MFELTEKKRQEVALKYAEIKGGNNKVSVAKLAQQLWNLTTTCCQDIQ